MKEILITSSVLIVVILLVRWLFRSKVSQKLIYAAWLLVALRLLVPIQFGQSAYSVTTLTEKIESHSKPIQQVQEVLEQPVAGPSRAELYQQLLNEYIQQNPSHTLPDAAPQITPEVQEQIEVQTNQRVAPTLSEILTAIWIAGMIGMAGWFLAANLIFLHRAKKNSTPLPGSAHNIPVRISPNVPTPCLVGFIRPVIYLTPASVENEQIKNHVLTHEFTHLRHWDHIWAFVRCICLCIYWFDPLVWIAASQSRRDCELACDESALKKLGDDQRIAYGQTLLATITQSMSPVHLINTATAMNETKKQIKERVSFIVKKPRYILIATICLVLVAAIAAGCTFAGSQITEPEQTAPTSTEPAPSTQSTEPIPSTGPTEPTPSTPSTTDPSSPIDPADGTPVQTLSAEEVQALQTAEKLIDRYTWYKAVGVCCEFDQTNRDLSQFLTTEQKKEYVGYQYRLKCCHTAQEVRAHIDSLFAPSVLSHGYPDDLLFTDDQGNLYLIVTPTEYDGYRHIKLEERSNDRIIASACIFDEDECWCSETFTMERKGDHFSITRILRNDTAPEVPSNAPPMSSADYHYDTITLAKERFGLTYVEFLYAGNKIGQPFYSEQTVPNALAMYQYILFIDHDNTVRMHFPVFSSGHPSYHVADFTVPEGGSFQRDAYRWFFNELGQTVDVADADAYAYMMTDSLFQDPDLFIRNLSQCSDDTVSDAASLIFNSLAPDEANVYKQLLDYLIKQYIASDSDRIKELKTVRTLRQPFASDEEDVGGDDNSGDVGEPDTIEAKIKKDYIARFTDHDCTTADVNMHIISHLESGYALLISCKCGSYDPNDSWDDIWGDDAADLHFYMPTSWFLSFYQNGKFNTLNAAYYNRWLTYPELRTVWFDYHTQFPEALEAWKIANPGLSEPPLRDSSGLDYEVNSDGRTCTVTGMGVCTDLDVVIPETIDGYQVTAIGESAFAHKLITSVIMPDSLTSISSGAFYRCTKLQYVDLGKGLRSINGSFVNCESLASIILPESLTSLGGGSFAHCTALSSIVIPSGVTEIESGTFSGCSNLSSVTLPNGLTSIGDYAFQSCTSLTKLSIPESVTHLGASTFQSCIKLTDIRIPAGVTRIEDSTFAYCRSLTEISIHEGVTFIGRYAFEACRGLKKVHIPATVTSIGWRAFEECSSVTHITVAKGNAYYHSSGNCLIDTNNKALIHAAIGAQIPADGSVERIEDLAFFGHTYLKKLVLPHGINYIGTEAFKGCTNLKEIHIPVTVTGINYPFEGCVDPATIYYGGTVAQWHAILRSTYLGDNLQDFVVICTDGKIETK